MADRKRKNEEDPKKRKTSKITEIRQELQDAGLTKESTKFMQAVFKEEKPLYQYIVPNEPAHTPVPLETFFPEHYSQQSVTEFQESLNRRCDIGERQVFVNSAILQKRDEQYKMKALKKRSMNAQEKRKKDMLNVPVDQCQYESLMPLHELWKEYTAKILKSNNHAPATFLKLDYHGAIVTVTRSKCPTYIGQKGIIVQETENTFKIVTKENKLKVIPKAHSEFSLLMEPSLVTIYGNHFCYRTHERSTRKFKPKNTIEIV
ncbi:RNase P protein subunit [Planoprotostelium fungivorum]|uniref:Ribonuclease P protein subunit p29 n=1 Tax=Planoprotostelium fungivorum TaxID=1890364 RepID=A0A2P6N6M9_9EUKA|nr:RNase P protein subunit [Planoprotostelium fungivorum]